MAEVICDVTDGLRPEEATVAIEDVDGGQQFLRVEREFLSQRGKKWYLPVGVVGEDPRQKVVLIELPHEADSGANRLWVRREKLFWPNRIPA